MGVSDLFSKRQKRARGEVPDVYTYEGLPEKLKVQIIYVWREAIGELGKPHWERGTIVFNEIAQILRKEYGVFSLTNSYQKTSFDEVSNWFLGEPNIELCLDAIELTCRTIDVLVRKAKRDWYPNRRTPPDAALEEINSRFREAGIGFQYESGQIIKVDSQLIHKEVVLPALKFLSESIYKGANKEFLNAHEHYRKGKYEESLVECLKAFESVMKVICHKRTWAYKQTDTASKLIEILFSNNLIPQHFQSQYTSLRTILESGIPTVRNRQGGHGQGAQTRIVPEYLASYQLHQTASAILFLIKAEKDTP